MLFVIFYNFYIAKLWVMADVIANFCLLCQMLIQHFANRCCFCDRCYVTVVMAFIVADVAPLW